LQASKEKKKRDARKLPEHLQSKSGRSSKRRRLDPAMDLRHCFSLAIEAMWQNPKSVPFQRPVDSRSNPQYRTIVKKPVDLNLIRTRNEEGFYKSRAKFQDDVQQMYENCRQYNTNNLMLVSDAKELLSICQTKLSEQSSTIEQAEAMIKLAMLLEEIVENLAKEHIHFRNPVSAKEFKDYNSFVKQPMDLSTIQQKIQKYSYASSAAFAEDIALIKSNCYAYCKGRYQHMLPFADKLWKDAENLIAKKREELRKLDKSVGQWSQLTQSKGHTPSASYPGTPGVGRSVPGTPGMTEEPEAVEIIPPEGEGEAMDQDDDGLMAELEDGLEELDEGVEEGDEGDLVDEMDAHVDDEDAFAHNDGLGDGMMAPVDHDNY